MSLFYPNEYAESTYKIDFQKYYDIGYRGLVFDIDNTLVPHDHPYTAQSVALFEELRRIGFKTCIISNNNEKRVKPFADAVGSEYTFDAHKPSKGGYLLSVKKMGIKLEEAIFIGDQILTDVLGARRAGMHCIMVKYIDPREKKSIRFKRKIENVILHFYKKKKKDAFQK